MTSATSSSQLSPKSISAFMRDSARITLTLMALSCLVLLASSCGSSGAAVKAEADEGTTASLPSVDQVPTFDSDLDFSVHEAYTAIPHRRTEMDFSDSKAPAAEQAYLSVAFATVDQAVLLRVDTLRKFLGGDVHQTQALRRMSKLIAFFSAIEPPKRLAEYHKLIVQSLTAERAFFQEWEDQGAEFRYANPSSFSSDSNVAAASSAARAAYSKLMQMYPDESAHNKDAFFDYHCALDFL